VKELSKVINFNKHKRNGLKSLELGRLSPFLAIPAARHMHSAATLLYPAPKSNGQQLSKGDQLQN
jgi:hypothetical protein